MAAFSDPTLGLRVTLIVHRVKVQEEQRCLQVFFHPAVFLCVMSKFICTAHFSNKANQSALPKILNTSRKNV